MSDRDVFSEQIGSHEAIKVIDDKNRAKNVLLMFHLLFNKQNWEVTTMATSQFYSLYFLEVGHRN